MKMDERPLISIVVPVYNTKKYLPKCIESILAQTYKNLEVLLVNDGSTDGSDEICNRFAEIDRRVKVINQQNSGVAVAVKHGISAASGEFIGFVDSDDCIESNMYEKLLEAARAHNADMVQCNLYMLFDSGKRQDYPNATDTAVFEDEDIKILHKRMLAIEKSAKYIIGNHRCTKLLKTDIARQNLDFLKEGIKIAEDLNFVFACLADVKKLILLPDFFYCYYQRENSASRGFKPWLEENYTVLNEALSLIIDKKGLGQDFEEALKHRKYANTLTLILNICHSTLSTREKRKEIKRLHKSSKRVKLKRKGVKKKLQQFFFEALLFFRLYRLIILTAKKS